MKAARAVEKSFADAKKALPINVDGAIGAILADLGMNPAAFNGIFMIARTPGLVAHVIEEQTREKPMRRIDPVNHGYDGPPPRNISQINQNRYDHYDSNPTNQLWRHSNRATLSQLEEDQGQVAARTGAQRSGAKPLPRAAAARAGPSTNFARSSSPCSPATST